MNPFPDLKNGAEVEAITHFRTGIDEASGFEQQAAELARKGAAARQLANEKLSGYYQQETVRLASLVVEAAGTPVSQPAQEQLQKAIWKGLTVAAPEDSALKFVSQAATDAPAVTDSKFNWVSFVEKAGQVLKEQETASSLSAVAIQSLRDQIGGKKPKDAFYSSHLPGQTLTMEEASRMVVMEGEPPLPNEVKNIAAVYHQRHMGVEVSDAALKAAHELAWKKDSYNWLRNAIAANPQRVAQQYIGSASEPAFEITSENWYGLTASPRPQDPPGYRNAQKAMAVAAFDRFAELSQDREAREHLSRKLSTGLMQSYYTGEPWSFRRLVDDPSAAQLTAGKVSISHQIRELVPDPNAALDEMLKGGKVGDEGIKAGVVRILSYVRSEKNGPISDESRAILAEGNLVPVQDAVKGLMRAHTFDDLELDRGFNMMVQFGTQGAGKIWRRPLIDALDGSKTAVEDERWNTRGYMSDLLRKEQFLGEERLPQFVMAMNTWRAAENDEQRSALKRMATEATNMRDFLVKAEGELPQVAGRAQQMVSLPPSTVRGSLGLTSQPVASGTGLGGAVRDQGK